MRLTHSLLLFVAASFTSTFARDCKPGYIYCGHTLLDIGKYLDQMAQEAFDNGRTRGDAMKFYLYKCVNEGDRAGPGVLEFIEDWSVKIFEAYVTFADIAASEAELPKASVIPASAQVHQKFPSLWRYDDVTGRKVGVDDVLGGVSKSGTLTGTGSKGGRNFLKRMRATAGNEREFMSAGC
ncbi:hypothetical protein M413DRAFT_10181 [Hebeloma cylindrosporum]|uniref:Uncharacterized protein n=1 Tax=Hebeloma cylindrosporum TaxID=76867 RepID=A0A0C2YNT0_HEBCY|nr:hypothetical protein M413DRAFT_10181 [Hebeloma cylindrosporum h7]